MRGSQVQFRGPIARGAWIGDEKVRQWFEIVMDAAVDPHQQRAYICKSCWQMFTADEELWTLQYHVEAHEHWGDHPYDSRRPSRILTGEELVALHKLLFEQFDAVLPEAGTWKFQCKACKKRFPHRSDHRELLGHFRSCEAGGVKGPVQ
jgi:hypothetical protein